MAAVSQASNERLAAMPVQRIYRSSNGDRWRLISDPDSGRKLVRHEPHPASDEHVTETWVEEFLSVNGSGPGHEALRRMLGTKTPPRRTIANDFARTASG
jgi:hypothetical protein